MRYRLRTLLILLAIGPPLLALAWSAYRDCATSREPTMMSGFEFRGMTPRNP